MLRTLPIGFKSKSQTFGIVTRKVGVLSPSARQFVERLMDASTSISLTAASGD